MKAELQTECRGGQVRRKGGYLFLLKQQHRDWRLQRGPGGDPLLFSLSLEDPRGGGDAKFESELKTQVEDKD